MNVTASMSKYYLNICRILHRGSQTKQTLKFYVISPITRIPWCFIGIKDVTKSFNLSSKKKNLVLQYLQEIWCCHCIWCPGHRLKLAWSRPDCETIMKKHHNKQLFCCKMSCVLPLIVFHFIPPFHSNNLPSVYVVLHNTCRLMCRAYDETT